MTPRKPKPGSIDRFGTHRAIVDQLPKIVAKAGYSTAVMLFVLWDRANAKRDGRTHGDFSVSAFARAIGATRKTVAAGLKYLTEIGWIMDADASGKPSVRPKVYRVYHVRHGESEEKSTNPRAQ